MPPVLLHSSLHNDLSVLGADSIGFYSSYVHYSNGQELPARFNEPKWNYCGTGFTDTLWIIPTRHRLRIHSGWLFFLLKDAVRAAPSDIHQDRVISTAERGVTRFLLLLLYHTSLKKVSREEYLSQSFWVFLSVTMAIKTSRDTRTRLMSGIMK